MTNLQTSVHCVCKQNRAFTQLSMQQRQNRGPCCVWALGESRCSLVSVASSLDLFGCALVFLCDRQFFGVGRFSNNDMEEKNDEKRSPKSKSIGKGSPKANLSARIFPLRLQQDNKLRTRSFKPAIYSLPFHQVCQLDHNNASAHVCSTLVARNVVHSYSFWHTPPCLRFVAFVAATAKCHGAPLSRGTPLRAVHFCLVWARAVEYRGHICRRPRTGYCADDITIITLRLFDSLWHVQLSPDPRQGNQARHGRGIGMRGMDLRVCRLVGVVCFVA